MTLNSHDIERAENSDRQVGERRSLTAFIFDHYPLVKRDWAAEAAPALIAMGHELRRAVLAVMAAQYRISTHPAENAVTGAVAPTHKKNVAPI